MNKTEQKTQKQNKKNSALLEILGSLIVHCGD